MIGHPIPSQRLYHQHISQNRFERPDQIVDWLGAVQAQDYAAAKWALGLRLQNSSDAAIEQAFTEGAILRTHVLRPTWHFVTPANIRWMLALTAPRVHAFNAYQYRQFKLDASIFKKSQATLAGALHGGRQMTRAELGSVLREAAIPTDELRLTLLMMNAELEGVLCSGARQGKQFTYALLDERAPQARPMNKEEALAELARRYFTSRGPATLRDFVWWSGLTTTDARRGLEMIKSQLSEENIAGETYWLCAESTPTETSSPTAYLLPNYDEYVVAYTERGAIYDGLGNDKLDARGNVLFNYVIVIDGQVVGTWKRTIKKAAVEIELTPFGVLTAAQHQAVAHAAQRYGAFLGQPVVLSSV